jgi:hypothetical protein
MPAISLAARSGVTLLEVLLTCALLGVLAKIAIDFLVPALHSHRRGLVQTELLRQASLALDKLTRDLVHCPTSWLSYDGAGHRLAGRDKNRWSADGVISQVSPLWLYHWNQKNLYYASGINDSFPSLRLSPTQLDQIQSHTRLRTLCTHLSQFTFESSTPSSLSGPYQIKLRLQVDQESLELGRLVHPRLSR